MCQFSFRADIQAWSTSRALIRSFRILTPFNPKCVGRFSKTFNLSAWKGPHLSRLGSSLETHYSDKLTVDFLAAEIGLGRRTLERRFRQATNNTVSEYVQRVRIEAAKKRLESGGKAVIEVMYDVGYSDLKAFRKVFKTITGMTPRDYRRKYNRDAVSI